MATRTRLVGLLFAVTGANALVIEQALEKLLGTVVGASTPAASLVLSTYFVGLAVGGLLYGRLRARVSSPLRLYAMLEGAVALCAFAHAALMGPIATLSARAIQVAGLDAARVLGARLAVAAIWVLPPTVCMGASFPSIVAALREEFRRPEGRGLARFYALNVLGAVAGAALGPYLLFAPLGVGGGLWVCGAVQIAAVATALAIARGLPSRPAPAPSLGVLPTLRALRRTPRGDALLLLAAGSGAIVFACEVAWLHLMGVTLGMSVYTFASLLGVVLAALFVGGLLVSSLPARLATDPRLVAAALALGALVLAVTSRWWDDVPAWLVLVGESVADFHHGEAIRSGLALFVVGPACAVLGCVYPLLLRSRELEGDHADAFAGVLGAANALGCMIGALWVSFAALGRLGAERTLTAIAAGAAILAIVPAWRATREVVRVAAGAAGAALAGVAALSALPSWDPLALTAGTNVYFRQGFVEEGSRLAFWHEDAQGGVTTVLADTSRTREIHTLLTNGKFQGSDGGESLAQMAFAMVPLALRLGRERALVVGVGTGHTVGVVAQAGFAATDVADLSEGVAEAARRHFGHLNRHALEQPSVTLHIEDGRNFLLRTTAEYDLIAMELTSVWFAGAGNLYSPEYYDVAKRHLRPGGVLQQWIQFHHITPDEVGSAIAALRASFRFVNVWWIGKQGILTASDAPMDPDPSAIATLRARPASAELVATFEALYGAPLEGIGRARLLDADGVDRLVADLRARGVPVHGDRNRFLEYWTPRHNLEPFDHAAAVVRALSAFGVRAEGAP